MLLTVLDQTNIRAPGRCSNSKPRESTTRRLYWADWQRGRTRDIRLKVPASSSNGTSDHRIAALPQHTAVRLGLTVTSKIHPVEAEPRRIKNKKKLTVSQRLTAMCGGKAALLPLFTHVCGTGWARAKAGRGVTTFPEGTHRTGHGALRTTRSISEPKAGAPPNNDA